MKTFVKLTVLSISLLLTSEVALASASSENNNSSIQSRAISAKLQQEMEQMIANEIQSFYVYTGMSVYFNKMGYTGMAHWASVQSNEELTHFQKQLDFALARNVSFSLKDVSTAKTQYSSPLEAFTTAYNQEKSLTTTFINNSHDATSEQAYDFSSHINGFITEQIEEENLVASIINRLEIAKSDPAALLLLDQELGARK